MHWKSSPVLGRGRVRVMGTRGVGLRGALEEIVFREMGRGIGVRTCVGFGNVGLPTRLGIFTLRLPYMYIHIYISPSKKRQVA